MAYLPESRAELEAIVAAAVTAVVPDAVAAGVRRALRKEYVTTAEACELTGFSRRKLAYLKSKRAIPYVKRGRTVLYSVEALEKYLMEGYVPTKEVHGQGK